MRWKLTPLLLLVISFHINCHHYTFKHYEVIQNYLKTENYKEAIKWIIERKGDVYGENERLLYYLDLGMLYHLVGEYAKSNEYFEKAERIVDELFTKSISKETASLLTSDYARPYDGEIFERVLINVIRALNYVMLGQMEDALVEARKVDHKLKVYKNAYGNKLRYRDDAFVRYLMGMIYETEGEINDSFISYRNALYLYRFYTKTYNTLAPPFLLSDVLRTAKILGFYDEITEIKKDFPSAKSQKIPENYGEIVIIHMTGLAPYKVEYSIQVAFGRGLAFVRAQQVSSDEEAQVNRALNLAGSIGGDVNVTVAFPKFKRRNYRVTGSYIEVNNGLITSPTYKAEDIEEIAIKDLEDRIDRIFARTVARAVIKYALAYGGGKIVEKKGGKLLGFLATKAFAATASMTEEADKRSWQLLPAQFRIAELYVPAGTHRVKVYFLDRNGNVIGAKLFSEVKVRKGKKTFLVVPTLW